MTEKEYRSHPAISRSELWKIRETPEIFKFAAEHPSDPTPALLFGQVAHKLLLEPETFDAEFAVAPVCDKRTVIGKKVYGEFLEKVADRTIVDASDYELAKAMVSAALAVPEVRSLLSGEREKPFFWSDPLTGEQCKCRVDCLTEIDGNYYIIDYKTAGDGGANTETFCRSAITDKRNMTRSGCYGYDYQSAMYADGVRIAMNLQQSPTFVFIVQEKVPPYAVNIIVVSEEVMANGYDVFRELIGKYHMCRESGEWHGYLGADRNLNVMELPAWMKGESA